MANGSGAWSYTTAALANGAHSLTADGDRRGWQYQCGFECVERDHRQNRARLLRSSVSDAIVNTNKVMLTGTAEANSKVTVFDGGALLGTASAVRRWRMAAIRRARFRPGPTLLLRRHPTSRAIQVPLLKSYDPIVGGTTIEANGSTSLTEVGNHFFLYDSGGSGPSLKSAGADFVAGQFGAWAPIGAEQTANGYEVAWKLAGADQYTVWNTDSSGNYISDTIGVVSGASYALQSLETSFHQDLNGDGQIGLRHDGDRGEWLDQPDRGWKSLFPL